MFVLLQMGATKNRLFLEMGYVQTIWYNALPYVVHYLYVRIRPCNLRLIDSMDIFIPLFLPDIHMYIYWAIRATSGDTYSTFLAKRTWYGVYNIYTLISWIANDFHILSRFSWLQIFTWQLSINLFLIRHGRFFTIIPKKGRI